MDKVGKNTGPGKIAELVVPNPNGGQVNILLFNYNFDGNLLKQEHTDYLNGTLIPFLNQRDYHVKLRGMASRAGDRDYNQQLALERVLRVKRYLTSSGIPESKVPGPDVSAVGEDYSTSAHDDDEVDRSVQIILARGTKPRPIFIPKVNIGEIEYIPNPPSIVPPKGSTDGSPLSGVYKKLSSRWRLQFLADGSIDAGPSFGAAAFRLHNLETNEESACVFQGMGMGLGTTASITMRGSEWTEFQTLQPVDIDSFFGPDKYSTFLSGPHYLTGMLGSLYKVVTNSSPGWSFLDFANPHIGVVRVRTGGTIGATAVSGQFGTTVCTTPEPYREIQPGEIETWINDKLQ